MAFVQNKFRCPPMVGARRTSRTSRHGGGLPPFPHMQSGRGARRRSRARPRACRWRGLRCWRPTAQRAARCHRLPPRSRSGSSSSQPGEKASHHESRAWWHGTRRPRLQGVKASHHGSHACRHGTRGLSRYSPSLSLSRTHTHTHTPPLSLSHTLPLSLSHTHTLYLSFFFSLSRSSSSQQGEKASHHGSHAPWHGTRDRPQYQLPSYV
ncbi:hypothetical protein T484DRAFT_3027346 [Baffinella frigidus]|nr:hypothetical protein T484DRAFT_3027346 [Cryptophyta sp. CCMP2293]